MKKERKTMDVILVILGAFLLAFIAAMMWLYYITGAIPDTLCSCVFAVCGGECGVMGWIKTTKERQQDHQWEQESKQAAKAEEATRAATAIALDTTRRTLGSLPSEMTESTP